MARKIEVEIVGDASSLERSYARAGRATSKFSREIQHASRGVLSGSGAFQHLGRSLAFASGGFLAFQGVTAFLTDSVKAARDAEKAQASLAAQMKAAGESFKDNQKHVEAVALSFGKFGFENDEVTKSITILERGTGKITRALGLQTTAANLARAKNIDLASASLVLAKVFGGQETALRRVVPGLDQNAHGIDLIREASKKLAGQAAANTTAAERFNAILHNTKQTIGTALLPILDRYLTSLGNWLDKMNRSGQLQRDVNSAVKTGTHWFQAIKAIVVPLAHAFKTLGDAVGGTKNEVELLAGAFLAFKGAKLLNAVTGIGTAVTGIGTAAEGANKKLGLLARNPLFSILALGALDVWLGKKALTQQATAGDVRGARSPYVKGSEQNDIFQAGLAGRSGVIRVAGGGTINLAQLNAEGRQAYFAGIMARLNQQSAAVGKAFGATGRVAGPTIPTGVRGGGIAGGPLSAYQQLQLGLAQHPDDIGLLRRQAQHDRAAIAFATRLRAQGRISRNKFFDEVKAYTDDLTSTLDHITSLQDQAGKNVAKRLRANIPGHVSGEAYGNFRFGMPRVPGLVRGAGELSLPFVVPLRLQVEQARAEATNNTGHLIAVLKAMRAAARKALRSGWQSLEQQRDAWNEIASLNDQIKNAAKDSADTYRQQRSRAIRLAHAQGADYQFAGARGVTITGPVHVHGVQNLAQLEDQLVKRARARPQVRRGR